MKYRPRRKPTEFTAQLVIESGTFPVTITDATETGVKVRGLGGYVFPDADAELVVQDQRYPGSIKWVDGDVVGLGIKRPLPVRVLELVTRSTRGSTSRSIRW